jgi:hypothetical protein
MQVEVTGNQLICIYSGREVPDSSQPEEKDPFVEAHFFHARDITGFRIDHQEQNFTFVVKGHPYPLCVEFGQKPNVRATAFLETLQKLKPVLEGVWGIPWDNLMRMNRRTEMTARVRSRSEDADSYGPEMGLPS